MNTKLIFAVVFTSGILALSLFLLAGSAGAAFAGSASNRTYAAGDLILAPDRIYLDPWYSGDSKDCARNVTMLKEGYMLSLDSLNFTSIPAKDGIMGKTIWIANFSLYKNGEVVKRSYLTHGDIVKEINLTYGNVFYYNKTIDGKEYTIIEAKLDAIFLTESCGTGLVILRPFYQYSDGSTVSELESVVVGSTAPKVTAPSVQQKPVISLISKGGLFDSYYEISIFDDGYVRKISGLGVAGRHPIYPDDILNLELENLRILDWQTEQKQLIAFLKETGFEQLKNLGSNVESDEIILVSLDGIHNEVVWGLSGDIQDKEAPGKFTKTWYTIDDIVKNASILEDNVKLNLKLSSNKTKFEKNESISFTLLLENSGDKIIYLSLPDVNSASIIAKIKDNKQSIIFPELHGIQLSDKTIALSPKENISFTLDIGTWRVKPKEGDYNEATYLKNTSGNYTITVIYSSYITNKQVLFGQIESNSVDFEIVTPPTQEVTAPGIKKPPDAEHPEKSIPAFELYGALFSVLIILFLNKGKIMR